MQTFRLGDVLRGLLLNAPKEPNLACPRQGLTGVSPLSNSTLWKETLAQRCARVTLARWSGLHLEGLASARVRSGHRAWEIDRLFLADGSRRRSTNGRREHSLPVEAAQELIESVVQATGEFGAERFFLRVPYGSPVVSMLRQVGFFPCFEESLWEGSGDPPVGSRTTLPMEWRELLPKDSFALFQLFCSATPHTVRAALGVTFDQWHDAQENHWRGRRDWVTIANDRIIGWLTLSHGRGVTEIEVMAHPDNPELWEALVERTVGQEGPQRWLVPDYQKEVPGLLLQRRFHEVARYSMMIKTVAVPVWSSGMAPVEA
jgi:hypothetical protein